MEHNLPNVPQKESGLVRVSVLMTVYNEERYIARSLDSVLSQTESSIEVVVVDDASTDGTPDILRHYAQRDRRIVCLRNSRNCGLVKSRIKAWEHSCGKYVMLVDADDFISPDTVESALHTIKECGVETAVLDLQMYYAPDDIRPYCEEKFSGTMSGETAFIKCVQGRLHGLCVEDRMHYMQVPFDDTCRLYSDDNTARIHYYISPGVGFCSGKYYYRQHAASETHGVSVNRFDYLLANISLRRQMLQLKPSRIVLVTLEIHRWKNIAAHYKLLFENRNNGTFSRGDRDRAMEIIGLSLESMDFSLLPFSLKLRPPYWPTHSLRVFVVFQRMYFAARRIKSFLFPKAKQ